MSVPDNRDGHGHVGAHVELARQRLAVRTRAALDREGTGNRSNHADGRDGQREEQQVTQIVGDEVGGGLRVGGQAVNAVSAIGAMMAPP